MVISDGNSPVLKAIKLRNSSAVITGGLTNGSMYLSNNGNGEVWVKVSGVWTQLTIN